MTGEFVSTAAEAKMTRIMLPHSCSTWHCKVFFFLTVSVRTMRGHLHASCYTVEGTLVPVLNRRVGTCQVSDVLLDFDVGFDYKSTVFSYFLFVLIR